LKTDIKRSRRRTAPVLLAGVAAFLILIVAMAASGQSAHVLLALRHARAGWLIGAAACQCGVYLCVAAILAAGLSGLKTRIAAGYLLYAAFAFLFANRALPGPAVMGLAALTWLFSRRGVEPAVAQATAATFYLADYLSFFTLGIVALFSLAPRLPVSILRPVEIAGSIVAAGLIAVAALTASLRAGKGAWIESRLEVLTQRTERPLLRRAAGKLHGDWAQFARRWGEVSRHPWSILAATGSGLAMHALESATLVCAAYAFGAPLDFLTAATAYVAANLAAIVSFLPGGVGFFEAALIGTLHYGAGMPLGIGMAVAALYRLMSLWIPAPSVTGILRQAQALPAEAGGAQVRQLPAEVDDAH
jgi:uncharacterized protein (TIRG00374 family)